MAWRSVLQFTTEITHEHPTRAAEIRTHDVVAVTISPTDRMYTTIPPHLLAETAATVDVSKLRGAFRVGRRHPLSDHIYVRTTLRIRPATPPMMRTIPPWITRHPLYAAEARRRVDAIPVEALHPHDALRRTKQAIRGAAATTRNPCTPRAALRPRGRPAWPPDGAGNDTTR